MKAKTNTKTCFNKYLSDEFTKDMKEIVEKQQDPREQAKRVIMQRRKENEENLKKDLGL